MISPVKSLSVFLALGLLCPVLASAKVVPLLEYTSQFSDKSTGKQDCSIFGAGWSSKQCASTNEQQKQAMMDGTPCYKCSCSATKYPYLYCPSSYFNQGPSCTADGVTQYASCSCKAPWRPSTDFVSNVMADFNYNTGTSLFSSAYMAAPSLSLAASENATETMDFATTSSEYATGGGGSSTSATSYEQATGSVGSSTSETSSEHVTGGVGSSMSATSSEHLTGDYNFVRGDFLSDRRQTLIDTFNRNMPTASDVNGNVLLTCYNPTLFSCKSGSKLALSAVNLKSASDPSNVVFTAKDESNYIRYKAKGIMKTASASGNFFCTTDVSFDGPLFSSTSRPADKNKCAEYVSGTTKYSPYKSFGYFNGECSTGGDCVGESNANQDCVVYGGMAVDTYNPQTKTPGTKTCRYINGCMSGSAIISDKTVMCGDSTINTDTYFESSLVPAGSITCKMVTGCKSPYQKAYFGAPNGKDYSKDGDYNYDVRSVSSGNTLLVCRQSQGCAVPTYDYSCSSQNWNGYLALWANTASK